VNGSAWRILADIDHDTWSPPAVDLDDVCDRLERALLSWRQALGRLRP
jgi:hypothetical protein